VGGRKKAATARERGAAGRPVAQPFGLRVDEISLTKDDDAAKGAASSTVILLSAMPVRYGRSPWATNLPKTSRPAYPRLAGRLEIPVAVVGGGLTGCATAYALSAAGQRVALIEGGQIGGGATAQAAGLLLASPGTDYLALERAHGRRVARALWQDTRRASLDAQAALRRLKIRCALQPCDAIAAARSEEEAKGLRRELAALKDAGIEAAWLTSRALAQATGIDGPGGIKTHGQASLDPLRAAVGLARAAAVRGAAVFDRSPVDGIRFHSRGVEIRAGKATVVADTVIVATGEPGALFSALERHFVRAETYVVLTPPLGAEVRRAAGTRDAIVEDRATPAHRLCWTSDDRILWSGADQPRVANKTRDAVLVQRTGQLMYELSLALPAISGTVPEFGWHAPWSRAVDELPFIGPHRNYPHHLFALGLGTNLAAAFLASRILVRAVTGATEKSDDSFGFARLAARR
jgi:glycine/D-amino acid oxidase-like deaminating enzyme